MKRFSNELLDKFLKLEKETLCSADHRALREGDGFWGDGDTISGMTISTTTTTTKMALK
ncbi:hypothetical protein GCM10007415_01430 [Parapedobacter pyrenivorans]|uniref:Uncharacterized protein n=1 Tax=Parapedobacter pyrenivorans TaxID=1305674 RepID=A0A917HBR6_9SPHI|nr:hypothetical protein [Parapedobacter pyrenivorans]GGG73788.1 hypothetical protein GCM10007415_01430 [Parapedobacter pyrenivorans]